MVYLCFYVLGFATFAKAKSSKTGTRLKKPGAPPWGASNLQTHIPLMLFIFSQFYKKCKTQIPIFTEMLRSDVHTGSSLSADVKV